MKYSKEEWEDIFNKNEVLKKLQLGISPKEIVSDIKKSGYECNYGRLMKYLERHMKKSKEQKLYYLDHQEEIIKDMNSIDIEANIDEISSLRYYSCFHTPFWERKNREMVGIYIDKEIVEEYIELSKEFGCDFDEEFLIYTLLEKIAKVRPKDKTREFILRAMNENDEITEEEINFILEKEREGYPITMLYATSTDYSLLDLSKEEFEKKFNKYRIDKNRKKKSESYI